MRWSEVISSYGSYQPKKKVIVYAAPHTYIGGANGLGRIFSLSLLRLYVVVLYVLLDAGGN